MDIQYKNNPPMPFTPSAPVRLGDNLIGRADELERCIDSLSEVGTHIALYGRRGVGKTSLLNVFLDTVKTIDSSKTIVRYECAHGDSYKNIFHALLSDIDSHTYERTTGDSHESVVLAEVKIPFAKGGGQSKRITHKARELHWESELRPSSLANDYLDGNYIFVLDEFDRVIDDNTKLFISDVLKAVSDNDIKSMFILVGISDTTSELIGKHPSVERCIKSVPVKPLSAIGIGQILTHGFSMSELKCSKSVINLISQICSGYPHYAHLAGLELMRHAIRKNKLNINVRDYEKIVCKIISNVAGPVKDCYFDFIFPNGDVNTSYDGSRDVESIKRELIALAASKHQIITFSELANEITTILDNKIELENRKCKKSSLKEFKHLFSVVIVSENDIETILDESRHSIFHVTSSDEEYTVEYISPMVKALSWFSLNQFLPSTCKEVIAD